MLAAMLSLSVKKVPEALVQALRARAERHHRSLQGELLAILEASVQQEATLTLDELYERGRARQLPARPRSREIVRQARDAR
jgi:plasmid stability protein